MRILVFHQYYLRAGEGGGPRFNVMCREWASSGHEVEVVAGQVHYATGARLDRPSSGIPTVAPRMRAILTVSCRVLSSF